MSQIDLDAFLLTLKLAAISTALLIICATPVAFWLSRTQNRAKVLIESVICLLMVLPPTVLGFYLLIAFGSNSPVGQFLESTFGIRLAFSFSGLVIGSMIYSLPFVVSPLQNSFAQVGSRTIEIAQTLRASPVDTFVNVVLPLAKPGFITATVLGFAHTMGEFGVVLMIGGNIPGKTKVLSIAIYDHVESMNYESAHLLSVFLLVFSILMLMIFFRFNKQQNSWLS